MFIASVTFITFLPSLQNGFVNWDDGAFLLDNPHYRGLSWSHLRWMFTTCYLGSCMPLNYLTYGLDYLIWGMNPFGYHLTSLLFHVANSVLFYFLSVRLFQIGLQSNTNYSDTPVPRAAAFSALFFSLHPLQVEPVAWILGRQIVVAGFFFFLTLFCYLNAVENASKGLSRWPWMVAAWVFYAMSLLSKEAALALSLALLVLDVYPLRRLSGGPRAWLGTQAVGLWLEKIPFLLLALAAGVKAILAKEQSGTIYSIVDYGLLPRFAQVLSSLAFYPSKTLVPTGLLPLYPLQPFTGLWSLPTLLSGAFVLSVTLAFFVARRRWPALLAAWLFYAALLIPVSGIVAFGPYRAADRFSYMPSLGWAMLGGAGLILVWQLWRTGRFGRQIWVLVNCFACVLLMILAGLSWKQSQIWRNSETLWTHALAVEERSSFAHNNLGLVFAERGATENAIEEFRRALQIDSAFLEARVNLANALSKQGFRDEALAELRQALIVDPAFWSAHNSIGNILAERGELDEAIKSFRMALQTNPESAISHYNLGRILAKRGQIQDAVAHYQRALEIDSEDADVHNNLGLLLAAQGGFDRAIEQFHEALRIDPNHARAHFNLGKIYARQERLDDAVSHLEKALRIQPAVAEIHEDLARTLARTGKKEEAEKHFREALRLLRAQNPRPSS